MTANSMRIGLVAALAAGQPALAQAPWPATEPSVQPCARERTLAMAEETTPGILQQLTSDGLAECLAAVFSAPSTDTARRPETSSGADAASRPATTAEAAGTGR